MARRVWHVFHPLKCTTQHGVGCILFGNEHFHTLTRNESRERRPDVCYKDIRKPPPRVY